MEAAGWFVIIHTGLAASFGKTRSFSSRPWLRGQPAPGKPVHRAAEWPQRREEHGHRQCPRRWRAALRQPRWASFRQQACALQWECGIGQAGSSKGRAVGAGHILPWEMRRCVPWPSRPPCRRSPFARWHLARLAAPDSSHPRYQAGPCGGGLWLSPVPGGPRKALPSHIGRRPRFRRLDASPHRRLRDRSGHDGAPDL